MSLCEMTLLIAAGRSESAIIAIAAALGGLGCHRAAFFCIVGFFVSVSAATFSDDELDYRLYVCIC